jgi:uncharacterized repeat protein (TIGR02543 family)
VCSSDLIPNGDDRDMDSDGVPNGSDPDVDADGIPNGSDGDIDSDGIPNGSDPDVDGDGRPNGSDPDIDADGIPNGDDRDIDSDGIPNSSDPDMDGDGIPNAQDPDMDADGIPNGYDADADADGAEDVYAVRYTLAGGTLATGSPTSYTIGSLPLPVPSPVRAGHTFTGWSGTAAGSGAFALGQGGTVPEGTWGDVTLDANWSPAPAAGIPAPGAGTGAGTGTGTGTPGTSGTSVTTVTPGSSASQQPLSAAEQAQVEGQTGNVLADLANGNVPLGAANITGAWSLASMLMALVAFIIAIVQGIALIVGRQRFGAAFGLALCACVAGVVIPLVWLASDRLNDATVWVNSWTPVVAVALGVQVAVLAASVIAAVRTERSEAFLDELLSTGAGDDMAATV